MNLVCALICWISKCQSSPGCIFFPMVCSVELPLGKAKKVMMVLLFFEKPGGLSIVIFTSPYTRNESMEPVSWPKAIGGSKIKKTHNTVIRIQAFINFTKIKKLVMNSLTRYTGFLCIVAFLSLSLFSCGGSPEEPVTAQHAKDFARQIQSSMEKRQAAFFDNAFDKKKFLKKAGLPNERDARAFSSALEDKLNMGTQLINSISEKGTYQ